MKEAEGSTLLRTTSRWVVVFMEHEFCGAVEVAPATVSDEMLQGTQSMGQLVGFIRSVKAGGFSNLALGQQCA